MKIRFLFVVYFYALIPYAQSSTYLGFNAGNGGTSNVGIGYETLDVITGSRNTAVGSYSMKFNVTGEMNCALGYQTLMNNTSGFANVAIGRRTMENSSGGSSNIAIGNGTMYAATGSENICLGISAGETVTGTGNLLIGNNAGLGINSGNYNTIIGRFSAGAASEKLVVLATNGGGVNGFGDVRLFFDSAGQGGIGTTVPKSKLDIAGSLAVGTGYAGSVAAPTNGVIIQGNVGIGTNAPADRLQIASGTSGNSGLTFSNLTQNNNAVTGGGKVLSVDATGKVILVNDQIATGGNIIVQASPLNTNVVLTGNGAVATPYVIRGKNIYTDDGTLEENRFITMNNFNMVFDTQDAVGGGRVYIGHHSNDAGFTPVNGFALGTGDYRLYVEGGVLTEKVKVALRNNTNWADYVFADRYNLKPLSDVASYIKEYKHLPGIESAEEIKKNGLDLGDMQAKQMEKIEELTLYAIEQDKKLSAQNEMLLQQQQAISELRAQLQKILNAEK